MMKTLITLMITLFLQATPAADLRVERKVNGQTLVSDSLPPVKLTFAKPFKYVGAQRFTLYKIASAEQHFFLDADAGGNIRRFYWLQFEAYLPDNTNTYNNKNTRIMQFDGVEFLHDTKLFTDYAAAESGDAPDSDSAFMARYLTAKGFKLPKTVQRIRMFDYATDKRSELMIIYVERLDKLPAGVSGETPADDAYPDVARAIQGHMKANLQLTRLKSAPDPRVR